MDGQLWQLKIERDPVAGRAQVAVQGVEVPQGRVGGVVEPFLFTFGKEVGYQSFFYIVGKCS